MTCAALTLVVLWDLAADDGGFVPSGTLQQWEHGIPSGATDAVWVTRLDRDTQNDAVEDLDIVLPATAGLTRPVLLVEHTTDLGPGDTARFLLDTGAGFEPLPPVGGYPGGGSAYVGAGGTLSTGLLLPQVPAGAVLRLRFEADASGAGPGWAIHGMRLFDGDPVPPVVRAVAGPSDNQDLLGPHRVEAEILEDVGLLSAEVVYDSGSGLVTVPMSPAGGLYTADLPAFPPDTTVDWRVEARDCNTTTSAVGAPFRVFLAAPTGLAGPTAPHTVDVEATLTWTPPVSPWSILGYVVRETGSATELPSATNALVVPIDPSWDQRFTVVAVYETPDGELEGDPTPELQLDVEVPELSAVEPSSAFPGDRVYLEISGTSLYLLEGLTTVSVGPGVSAGAVEVRDVDRATVLLTIDPDATPGPRSLDVSGAQGVFRFEGAFHIEDGALAPRITSVTPSSIIQGAEATVVLEASRRFEGPVTVLVDDDFIVASEPVVLDDRVTVDLVAIGAAQPGPHDLVLDDGRRLYTATLRVDEYRVPTRTACDASGPTGGMGLAGILALAAGGRRRSRRCRMPPTHESP
ncbi:MAG: hypothetical protein KC656_07030 [Myxococcales bacterium]|nr:hypothetical protein [Myxococcales bacterium]MCB9690297.1 hypothetical protein [Alphaproteobacteria bacterium]